MIKMKGKGWYGNRQAHSMASKGVRTAVDETREWEHKRMAGLKEYYISYLDRIKAFDIEDFYRDADKNYLVDGLDEDEWIDKQLKNRLMDYPENADYSHSYEGDGWVEIIGRIYFDAKTDKDAVNKAMRYDFNSMNVYSESGVTILSI